MKILNTKIEKAAVEAIDEVLYYSTILDTHIPTGDKEPCWDGNIYIKRGNKKFDRVPVQVKGKIVKKVPSNPSFPVSKLYLENYKRDGGILYFVVYQINKEKHIYYADLAPIALDRLIKIAGSKKSLNIHLDPFPTDIKKIESLVLEFYNDCRKQHSFSDGNYISLEDAIKQEMSINFSTPNKEDLLDEYHFLYAKSPDDKFTIPIGDQKFKINIIEKPGYTVSVNGVQYDFEVSRVKHKGYVEVFIGNVLKFIVGNTSNSNRLDIQLKGKLLSDKIKEYNFIKDIISNGKFELDGKEVKINHIPQKEKKDILKRAEYWRFICSTLEEMHCPLDLIDTSKFTEAHFRDLEKACHSIKNGESITHPGMDNTITIDIGDYSLLLWTEKTEDNRYKLFDFFKKAQELVFAFDDKGKKLMVPFYSYVFLHPQLLKFINFDFDNVIENYEYVRKYNPQIIEQANQDVLNILLCYDKDPNRRVQFLETADNLINWIINHNDNKKIEWIYTLNSIQLEKRINGILSKDSLNKLYQITDLIKDKQANWAVSVLLEESYRAKKYWEVLEDEQKQLLIKMPIYTLYKNLIKNSQ